MKVAKWMCSVMISAYMTSHRTEITEFPVVYLINFTFYFCSSLGRVEFLKHINYLEFYIGFFVSNIKPIDYYELFELPVCSKGQGNRMALFLQSL